MESFYPKNSNKTLNNKAIKQYVVFAIQGKNQQNQHQPNTSFIFHAKKS